MNNEENVNQNDARAILDGSNGKHKICLLSIIGEVEGHENLSGNTKTTKYDQILPKLAQLEDDDSVEGPSGIAKYLWRRCRCRPGDCGDDRLSFHADGITGPGRQPFHRSAACSVYRSFLYCADRDHDGASGADERNRDRGFPDL